MYEKLENCPSCNHPQFENFLICKDHSVSQESFALVQCTNCQLIFTNPRPKKDELSKYYQSDDYISHTDASTSFINLLYKLARTFTLQAKLRTLRRYQRSGTILDYGCGTGDFLRTCLKARWSVQGIEPDEKARTIAENKLSITLKQDISEIPKNTKYDVITAWHVLEHVSDLRGTLKNLRKRLEKEGFLFIAVPNVTSHDAQHYREYWAAYDVPRHLYHFSQESFNSLITKSKLKLIDTLPMKLDAYYVSLLSERYLNGKNRFIPALIEGLESNNQGSKTGNYSSLIYVLTK